MISLKSLMKNIKEMKIAKPKRGKETPLDANVQIPGYGVLTRNKCKVVSKDILRKYQLILEKVIWNKHTVLFIRGEC